MNPFSWNRRIQERGKKFFSTPAPLPFHFDMLHDKRRVEGFKTAFKSVLQKTDKVLEIGAGIGILSLLAEPHCESIVAIEMNHSVCAYGKKFIKNYSKGKIDYRVGNIRNLKFPEKFDAIICEIMDTGFFSEAQIGVMNFAVENLLKEGGKVIPFRAQTSAQLVFADYHVPGLGLFPLPFYETSANKIKAYSLSDPVLFHEARFTEINDEHIVKYLIIQAKVSGSFNGLRFITNTFVTNEIMIEPTDWLNPWLIIPLEESFATKGQLVRIEIAFSAGEGISSVKLRTY